MKRTAVLFAAGLATLLLSGPAFAADPSSTGTSGTTSSDRTGATAPAEKPSTLSMPHHVTGSVVSVNKKTNSVSIKDTQPQSKSIRLLQFWPHER